VRHRAKKNCAAMTLIDKKASESKDGVRVNVIHKTGDQNGRTEIQLEEALLKGGMSGKTAVHYEDGGIKTLGRNRGNNRQVNGASHLMDKEKGGSTGVPNTKAVETGGGLFENHYGRKNMKGEGQKDRADWSKSP